jgi:prolycopene isomerase
MEHKYDAIVIGGGLAGLTCSLALVNKGKRVRLIEKMPVVGGYQGYFQRKGFFFEPCFHSVTEASPDGVVTRALNSLNLREPPSFVKLDPTARIIFPDETFTMPSNREDYQALLKKKFPNQTAGIEKIFRTMSEIYEGFKRLPETTPALERYRGKVFQHILDEFISDKRLMVIISAFWGYLGVPPTRASAPLFSAFFASLYTVGSYFPLGGITRLVNLLEQTIRERGGEITLKCPAQKILIEDGKVCGVLLEHGEEIRGDAIISNIDALTTFFQMIGEQYLPPDFVLQLKKLQTTPSSFSVFLGVKNGGVIPKNSAAANIIVFPEGDFKSHHEAIREGKLENAPYCLAIPTLIDSSLAPPGHHIVSLHTAIPYRPEGITHWKEKKEHYTEKLIDLAEKIIPGLRKYIVVKEAATPDTLVRFTGNSRGAVGGWDYTPDTDEHRPGNKTPLEGLWLTGHWTFPGVGVHNVIQSGCLTASLIP